MDDLIPFLIWFVIPGLATGIIVVLTRRLSAQVFWSLLVAALALLTGVFAVIQVGKEVMNGPLATALAFMLPAATAMSFGRFVKRWPVLVVLASVVSYAVAYVFVFSYGVNARLLGKPFP